MKVMSRLLVLTSFLVSFHVFAGGTLLVTDVDDTIKVANIASLSGAAIYSFDEQSRYAGMPELFRLLKKANPDLEVYYLSNAPTWYMQATHENFLGNGHFLKGTYIGRSQYPSDTHKILSLREIIDQTSPDKVVFLGDNTEADPQVYAKIVGEYSSSNIQFYTFIRQVVAGAGILDGQVGFVSPVEVALTLGDVGFIPQDDTFDNFINRMVPKILSKKLSDATGVVAFPYFVDCRDFVWRWDNHVPQFPILNKYKDQTEERCSRTKLNATEIPTAPSL
jgi:hypothetical protein